MIVDNRLTLELAQSETDSFVKGIEIGCQVLANLYHGNPAYICEAQQEATSIAGLRAQANEQKMTAEATMAMMIGAREAVSVALKSDRSGA